LSFGSLEAALPVDAEPVWLRFMVVFVIAIVIRNKSRDQQNRSTRMEFGKSAKDVMK
jgi:hypothetical protein